ncbi:MAG: hypothetical protein HC853_01770, partial [Anaerolineae bacterium]|nr:hypothetical protein [Anaerolineae bacterium]
MQQLESWAEANQRYLVLAMARVRACLNAHIAQAKAVATDEANQAVAAATQHLAAHRTSMEAAQLALPALEALQTRLNLSSFEADTLLLCAGMELEGRFGALCAAAQGDSNRAYPTFSLALAALPGAHWSALMPDAPLRKHELLEFAGAAEANSAPLTTRPIRIQERVVHFLVGATHTLDDRLSELAERIEPRATWDDLVLPPDQIKTLRTLTMHVRRRDKVYGEWGFAKKSARGLGICALFAGASGTGKTLAAEVLANALSLNLYRIGS